MLKYIFFKNGMTFMTSIC